MRINFLLAVALAAAVASQASPLPKPQTDYGGVTETPPIQGLDGVLATLQGSLEKLTQALQGKQKRDDGNQNNAPTDPPEIALESTPLGSIPELIPLLTSLGIPSGNH